MPDTFTHIALPALFRRYARGPVLFPVLLLGTVLPDYLREFFALLLPVNLYGLVYVFHTIAGAAIIAFLTSVLFVRAQRGAVFISILLGQLLHFGFDILQGYHCTGRFYLFFPWRKSIEIGLIPEHAWLVIFSISFFSFVSFILIHYIKSRRKK